MAEIAARLTGETPVMTHEDIVKQTADKVLEQVIPWEGYQKANLIEEKELELIKRYDKKNTDVRLALFQKEGDVYAALFLDLMVKSSKEETLQYLLTLVDQLIKEFPESIRLFLRTSSKNPQYPFTPFVSLLQRSYLDWYTNSKASNILAILMGSSPSVSEENTSFLCHWIREQLRKHDERDICNALYALQKILVKDSFRESFAKEDGLQLLGSLLKSRVGNTKAIQIVYQILYCLWLLSYNKSVASLISETRSIINTLVDVLKLVQKEKGIRMSLATLRNLLNVGTSNEQMIDCDIMKFVDNLSHKNWADDDIKEDIEALQETLQKNIVVLSSFDMYKREVLSGNLEWSPVHKSEKFWRENAHRLEEDHNKLLLVLKSLLAADGGSKSTLVQSVACFDIGEFARHHPRGIKFCIVYGYYHITNLWLL